MADKCNGNILHFDKIRRITVCLVKTGIGIHHIKIIDIQRICRTFILNDIVSPKDSSDVFLNLVITVFFDDQNINLFWPGTEMMLILKRKMFPFAGQFNLDPCIECGMPLQQFPAFLHTPNLLIQLSGDSLF